MSLRYLLPHSILNGQCVILSQPSFTLLNVINASMNKCCSHRNSVFVNTFEEQFVTRRKHYITLLLTLCEGNPYVCTKEGGGGNTENISMQWHFRVKTTQTNSPIQIFCMPPHSNREALLPLSSLSLGNYEAMLPLFLPCYCPSANYVLFIGTMNALTRG